jgi:hypothetical protein
MADSRIVLVRGANRLELEGETDFVERQLADLLPLIVGEGSSEAAEDDATEKLRPAEMQEGADRHSLRSFVASKAPRNTYDAIACVLFFARSALAKPELTADEIRAFLIQAKQRPPGVIAQALTDAKRRHGFVEAGTRKGSWRLSHAGEVRVEFELPSAAEQ